MTIQASSGAISNGEYLAWMAEHTGELYDEMRVAMDFADRRSDLAERLGDIKARLAAMPAGGQVKEPTEWAELQAELRALVEAEAESPEAAALQALLAPMADAMTVSPRDYGAGDVELLVWEAPAQESVSSWCDQLQTRIDKLHKDDQMALINIQDLNAQVQQATQLASSLIAATNHASNAVVANIKG